MRLILLVTVCLFVLTSAKAQDISDLQSQYAIPEVISVYELEEHKVTLLHSKFKAEIPEEDKYDVLYQWATWLCDMYKRDAVGPLRIWHRKGSTKGPAGNYYDYACAIR